MGFDLLTLGSQSVLTAQRQLNTTGHNIANVNTQGYSRQRVEQGTNETSYWGGNQWGNGVHAVAVSRNYDKFAVNDFNLATTTLSHAAIRNNQLSLLDDTMAHSAKQIPNNMNEFYGALKGLTDSPGDMGARQVVLDKSRLVVSSFNELNTLLQTQETDTSIEIDATLNQVNNIGKELVDVQRGLLKSAAVDNDLLDRQDRLVNELSEFTQVTVNRGDDGLINVIIGSGHTLVSGLNASELRTVVGVPDPQKRRLALVEGKSLKAISHADIGGKLGGMFEYRDKTLGRVRDSLGALSVGFAMSMNELQFQGIDLNGDPGSYLFNDFNRDDVAIDRVVASSDSKAELKVYIEDISKLKMGDYQLKFDGTQYTMITPEQKMIPVSPSGTPPSFQYDGLNIQVDVGLSPGERVIIRPMRQAAGQIRIVMEDPAKIAAQSFIGSESVIKGEGSLKILQEGAQKEFKVMISPDASQFAVLDMQGEIILAPQTYPPSTPVNVNGTVFELTGGGYPQDVFSVSLIPADGDNGNAIFMQNLQTKKVMNDGRSSLIDIFEGLNTEIGVQKSSFSQLEEVTRVEHNAAAGRIAEISGVNLDEEAANMMKFQQAYMASSRIMTSANETFEALLNATR